MLASPTSNSNLRINGIATHSNGMFKITLECGHSTYSSTLGKGKNKMETGKLMYCAWCADKKFA